MIFEQIRIDEYLTLSEEIILNGRTSSTFMRMSHVFEKNLIFGKTGFKQLLDIRMHKLYYIFNITF